MKVRMTVRKLGNSLGVVVPSDICKLLEIRPGDVLEVPLDVLKTVHEKNGKKGNGGRHR